MSDAVHLDTRDGIAIISIDNPPVNAVSPGVPQALARAFARVQSDQHISGAVLIGKGATFIAGADIREFAKITSGTSQRFSLLPLLRQMEDCTKPIVIAIHGMALGGGLEIAMAGHYRVAVPNAKVGLPEVKLGLIPGAGGTQRLPRLAGVAHALQMCVEGNPIGAAEALERGIIDRLIEGDLLEGAIAFAQEVSGPIPPKTREHNKKLGTPQETQALFETARQSCEKTYRGRTSPLKAIEAIEAATLLSFEESCEVEQRLFEECLYSEESKALVHIFFGERQVTKIPGLPADAEELPVNRVAVIGAGTMGAGISMVFANAGFPVLLKETDGTALERGLATIGSNYSNSVKRGRLAQEFVDQRIALIHPTLSYEGFDQVDMVVEAVFEGMAEKKRVFSELDAVCRRDAVLATNTSTLSIDEIASVTKRPASVIGTHFFSPANVMRLLEIVRGKDTGDQVIATCMQLAKRLRKVGVLVGNCKGFVGNRMFNPYRREAQFLVEEGSSVEAVDKALYEFGMAMGPLATGDLAGLDIGWRVRKEFRHLEKPGVRQPVAEDNLCELGRFGQKTRAGWYLYDENRKPMPDPDVEQHVRGWAAKAAIPQRSIPPEEILDRCLYALVNEAARILEEGIALRSVDIDIIYVNGYGFPAYRGGPLWYADTVGLKKVCDRVREFHEQHGENWEPANLLVELAEKNGRFSDMVAQ